VFIPSYHFTTSAAPGEDQLSSGTQPSAAAGCVGTGASHGALERAVGELTNGGFHLDK